jgi:hypothetical protein
MTQDCQTLAFLLGTLRFKISFMAIFNHDIQANN